MLGRWEEAFQLAFLGGGIKGFLHKKFDPFWMLLVNIPMTYVLLRWWGSSLNLGSTTRLLNPKGIEAHELLAN